MTYKIQVGLFILLSFIISYHSAIANNAHHPFRRLFDSGDISGRLITCPTVAPSTEPFTVFIPGLSFVVKVLPNSDAFRILNIPAGEYKIGIETPKTLKLPPLYINNVEVNRFTTTDLGSIDLCAHLCLDNNVCEDTDFCQKPLNACTGFGRCDVMPITCTQEYDPVCGCDGNTYNNACAAQNSGVNIGHNGQCIEDKIFCGGIAGITCPESYVCIDNPGDGCDPEQGGADCGGICIKPIQ